MRKILLFIIIFYKSVFALTLDEAINMALTNLPQYKEAIHNKEQSYYNYQASKSGFFPQISYSFNYSKYTDYNPYDFFSRNHALNVIWYLFDSGNTYFGSKINFYTYKSYEELLNKTKSDIIYNVKVAYYQTIALKQIAEIREIAVKNAQIDYEIAIEKKELGLVKLSDVLQAKVRFENAKLSLIQAKNDYKKSLSNLNSLIGNNLEEEISLDEKVLKEISEMSLPQFDKLKQIALENRPEYKYQKYILNQAKESINLVKAQYLPSLYLQASFNNGYSSLTNVKNDYNVYSFGLQWNIFSGFKREFNYLSAKEQEKAALNGLKEIERTISVNLYNKYLDLETSFEKLNASKTTLEQAKQNYEQAIGEYKAGTGDILSLTTAETLLANAHETYINSLLDIAISVSNLERELNIYKLEDIARQK
ncbi:TolC family protein [Venenivibrio stagnispumantis]|uniref:Outer membrane protein TolC n=1 Tax=Venenivibrio stagnispumantis TaxID=407998 RepID=A0AA45WM04_9AQUI|nr:TolC family protein [Venenivibrio stagnispumantis]MCW4573404.1 TolC family protein [Venenivibrio stagnispumantis]SMP12295.1 Outer membrane protein TolC [Venenivibrio stagnispumantis]